MRKQFMVLVVILVVAAVPALAESPRSDDGTSGVNRVQATMLPAGTGGTNRAVGTIMYDNNTPFDRDGTLDGTVGNRFNDGVTDPHSIASVSFRIAGNYGTSVVMSIWDPNTVAGSASLMTRLIVTGLPDGRYGTVTGTTAVAPLAVPITGHSGSFIAGVRNTFYGLCSGDSGLNSTCDGVALTAGVPPEGSIGHAVRLNFVYSGFLPTVTTLSTSGVPFAGGNAIFRATGDNLPVELMRLEVE